MAEKSREDILTEIIEEILTGGRRTKAVDLRQVLADITNSSYNIVDDSITVGSLITDGTIQSNLSNNTNWDSLVGGNYTGTTITGQNEHDYFVDAYYKYEMVFIGSSLLPIRILRTPS